MAGSRGPIGKPAGQRQHHGKPAPLTVLPGGKKGLTAPDPSGGLTAAVRRQWEDLWASPLAALVEGTDLPALERLFLLYDERERCWKAYRKARLVKGSQGQPVMSPLARQVALLDVEIRHLEDRFGLSPRARLRL